MIIETTDNRLFGVRYCTDPTLAHVWQGYAVRRGKIRGTYEIKSGARLELIRRAGSKVVSSFRIEAESGSALRWLEI